MIFKALCYLVLLLASRQLAPLQAQNCSLISLEEVNQLITELCPCSDSSATSFSVLGFNVTCLALAVLQDHYRFVTVYVDFTLSQFSGDGVVESLSALMDVGCSSDNRWESSVLGLAGTFTWMDTVDPGAAPGMRTDCAECAGKSYDQDLFLDTLTHCLGQSCPSCM